MKVLYVDALRAPNAIANVAGMTKAYSKVAQVRTFDYRTSAKQHGDERMNRSLVQVATEFEPDFIHLGKCESVKGWSILGMRSAVPNVKIIYFFGDYRPNVIPWVVDIGRACDRTVMQVDGGPLVRAYEKAGCKNIGYWPAGTDPEIYGPRKVGSRDLSVVFMGTLGNPTQFEWYAGRRKLVEALARQHRVNVFGGGWDKVKHTQVFHRRYVGSEGFSQACSRAEIALGYGAHDVPGYTSWPRVLNSMACGVLFLTRYFVGLEKIFERGVHLDWFESIPEAVEKAHYYLEHKDERNRIARQGRAEVLRNHTWDKRIELMLSYAGLKAQRGKVRTEPPVELKSPVKPKSSVKGKPPVKPKTARVESFGKRPTGSKPPKITEVTREAEGEPVHPLVHSLLSRRMVNKDE